MKHINTVLVCLCLIFILLIYFEPDFKNTDTQLILNSDVDTLLFMRDGKAWGHEEFFHIRGNIGGTPDSTKVVVY